MNKEKLIKGLEYTEKRYRDTSILDSAGLNISAMCSDALSVLKNCIEIPEGATNGDVIKILFPNVEVQQLRGSYDKNKLLGYRTWLGYRSQDFLLNWWNAPFNIENVERVSPELDYADQDTMMSAT